LDFVVEVAAVVEWNVDEIVAVEYFEQEIFAVETVAVVVVAANQVDILAEILEAHAREALYLL